MMLCHQLYGDGARWRNRPALSSSGALKGKSMAQCARHLAFPNGAPMAHDGACHESRQGVLGCGAAAWTIRGYPEEPKLEDGE